MWSTIVFSSHLTLALTGAHGRREAALMRVRVECVDNNEGLLLLAYRGLLGILKVYPHNPQQGGDQ
jgi:hypothetical protein